MNKITEQTLNALDPTIEHFGVKGMKWKVRRSIMTGKIKNRGLVRSVRFKDDFDKLNTPKDYLTTFSKNKEAMMRTFKYAKPKINSGLSRINNSKEYKHINLNLDYAKRLEYNKTVSDMVTKQLNAAARFKGKDKKFIGGSYRLEFKYDVESGDPPTASVKEISKNILARKGERDYFKDIRKFRHADTTEIIEHDYPVSLTFDALGYITSMDIEDVDLEHSGVKGMKWGVRRRKSNHRNILSFFAKKKSSTKKGVPKEQDSDNPDLVDTLKNKSVRKMTNAEISKLNTRMQLERSMKDLKAKEAADLKAERMKHINTAKTAFKTMNEIYGMYKSPMVQDGLALLKKAKK